jgi:dolichol kinase
MFETFLALCVIGSLLILSEFLWRKKIIAGEYGRKVVHMSMGLFIAAWPYFLTMQTIQLISCAAILTLVVSRKFKIFHAIHDVKRRTYGELLYPLSILIIALFARADWIFTVAVLFVALADGMAAVVGKKWGKKYTYRIGSTTKTVVGSLAYIVFAYVCLGIGYLIGGKEVLQVNHLTVYILLPLISAMLEAVSPYGTDNITAPLFVVLVLNGLLR